MVSAPDEVHDVEPAAAPTNDGQFDGSQIHANVQPEASDVLPGIAIDTEPTDCDNTDGTQRYATVELEASVVLPGIAIDTETTNAGQIDGTQIHATVELEASVVRRGIAIDTESTNDDDIDGTQTHANVQLEELPDARTIRSYTCPCQCESDHDGYELQPPMISYHDYVASDMGSPYGHGCIPSAFLRMTQAQLDYSAAEIMADTTIYEQRVYWLQQARTRLYRATKDYTKLSQQCHCSN